MTSKDEGYCIPNTYESMINEIGTEKFKTRFEELKNTADRFISEAGYQESVVCNERILLHVLLDYYSDVFRLKEFHDIKKIRTEKIFAYKIAWIIKRKPLQFICYSENEIDMFVNERFAQFLLINECLLSGEKKYVSAENQDKLDAYLELVLYYFKYRTCNPQVIELMIESFKMGTLVNERISDN